MPPPLWSLLFGVVAIMLSLVQAVLMLFRQAALVILAGVLPLAAAGSIAPLTRPWVRKVTAWMLALIFYKPAAAAVYATAFTMVGSGGSRETMLMGFVMLLLSVLTLPALMKFFTWTTGTIASSGGGGQLLGAATVGAIAIGAMRHRRAAARRKNRPPTWIPGSALRRAAPPARRPGGPPPGGPGSTGPAPGPSGAAPSGPSPATTAATASGGAGTGAAPTGAATTGTAPGATAPATAAGPAGAAAAAGTQILADGTRRASGAMDPGDQQ